MKSKQSARATVKKNSHKRANRGLGGDLRHSKACWVVGMALKAEIAKGRRLRALARRRLREREATARAEVAKIALEFIALTQASGGYPRTIQQLKLLSTLKSH